MSHVASNNNQVREKVSGKCKWHCFKFLSGVALTKYSLHLTVFLKMVTEKKSLQLTPLATWSRVNTLI